MKINLGGIVNISTVDWHGKVSMVIFLRGCPLRCIYCQNYDLLEESDYVEVAEIDKRMQKVEDFIDAVVLSGGEPFMQPYAVEEISKIAKRKALEVGVQTNGFYPSRVEYALNEKLIDKIFLDVKAPLSDTQLYEKLTQVSNVVERVKRTLEICKKKKIELEVVTTLFRDLVGLEEVKKIVQELKEMEIECTYVIQQGRPELAPTEDIKKEEAFSREELYKIADIINKAYYLKEVRIRTKERGEEVL